MWPVRSFDPAEKTSGKKVNISCLRIPSQNYLNCVMGNSAGTTKTKKTPKSLSWNFNSKLV